jgi:hypothetical protein
VGVNTSRSYHNINRHHINMPNVPSNNHFQNKLHTFSPILTIIEIELKQLTIKRRTGGYFRFCWRAVVRPWVQFILPKNLVDIDPFSITYMQVKSHSRHLLGLQEPSFCRNEGMIGDHHIHSYLSTLCARSRVSFPLVKW